MSENIKPQTEPETKSDENADETLELDVKVKRLDTNVQGGLAEATRVPTMSPTRTCAMQ